MRPRTTAVGMVSVAARLAAVAVVGAVILTGCGSGGASKQASSGSASTPPTTVAAAAGGGVTCPSLAQADTALGVSDSGTTRTPTQGSGVVCAYTGNATADVTIFAYESPQAFSAQVASAGTTPGMQQVSGVGDGAFGLTANGRSSVNAYSNASRTFVEAAAPGALARVQALARAGLVDND
jgi:hypothetical protein